MHSNVSKHAVTRVLAAGMLALGLFSLSGCSSCSTQLPGVSGTGTPTATDATQQTAQYNENTMFTVPNVVSLTQADAEKAILASGLRLGTVTQQPSDTVPLGCVISQDPKALGTAKANSQVNLVISSGKEKAKKVQVPDLKGLSQSDAERELNKLGLIGVATAPEVSSAVAPGKVFKQSIGAGTNVLEGTKVSFTVALAPSEAVKATVPNVMGKTKDDAKKALMDAGLGFDYTEVYSDNVAEGKVITQSLTPGSKVSSGTTVTVTVSLGAKPAENVKVPNVMTYTWTDAEAALRSAGLSARYTGDPAGVVTAQDIPAGTEVAPNTLVTVTLSSPVQMVTVPDLIGLSVTSAEIATDEVGLSLDIDGSFHGIVDSQWPAAGTLVEVRTTVRVTVDDSDFSKTVVPDLVGQSVATAEIDCDEAGLVLKIDEGGLHGTVETQTPEAGEKVDPQSEVHITVDDSDFRGEAQDDQGDDQTDDTDQTDQTADTTDTDDTSQDQSTATDGSKYIGTRMCDRATLTIKASGSNYLCTIDWSSSYDEGSTWEYTCVSKDGKLVDSGKGVKKENTYDEDGDIASSNTIYTDGSAEFSFDANGNVIWNDLKEDAGRGMAFR